MNFHPRLILLSLILLPLAEGNAARQNYNDNLLEFTLSAEHQNTQFKFSNNEYKTRFDLLGINWYEPFSPYFHAGLEIGKFNMTQTNNNLPSAQFTNGQYAGLLLRFIPFESQHINISINLNYRYNQSDGISSNQKSQFAWHENALSAVLHFHLSNLSRFYLAADYHKISGEQRDSGTITQITTFTEQYPTGYQLGMEFSSDRHNLIRLGWLAGYRDGAQLSLTYRF